MKSSERSPMREARLSGGGVNGAETREPGRADVTAKTLNTGPYQVLPNLTSRSTSPPTVSRCPSRWTSRETSWTATTA